MKFFFSFYFLVASCGLSVGTLLEYTYFPQYLDWNVANWYCSNYYKNLAVINNPGEQQILVDSANGQSGWIGLQRTDVTQNIWKWSMGEDVSYSNWLNDSPLLGTTYKTFNCTFIENGYWKNDFCGKYYPFYCSRYLILVNESKTWEEARQYCTTNYIGLTSLPYMTQVLWAQAELNLTQTDSIWTGLRFMDGNWFWLNGEPLETPPGSVSPPSTPVNLPACPAQPYSCGALNIKTYIWENRDCNEKLNFLCWS